MGAGSVAQPPLAFAKEGADVVLAARTDTEINAVAEEGEAARQTGTRH